MHPSWQSIRELMQHESRLVGKHSLLIRPEPDGGEVLMLGCWRVNNTVDAPANPDDAPVLQVLEKELRRVSSFLRYEHAWYLTKKLVESVAAFRKRVNGAAREEEAVA